MLTINEVKTIKELITLKNMSTPNAQKGIRNKIRGIGFYYSDFSSSEHGYTVEDFESIINTGIVSVK